jgi:hypothetical protein
MKILALTITKDDTTSYYRAAGIMRNLISKLPGLTVDIHDVAKIGNLTWSLLCQYDGVFLQRPWNTLPLVKFLKEMKIPIWMDYDDNLFEIPQANSRAFDTFADETVEKNMVEIAKLADIITVSTKALKTLYDQLCKDVRVIPNAINYEIVGDGHHGPVNKTILWRGGDSHRMDLRFYETEIMDRQEKFTDWLWIYAGYNPWEFITKNKKYRKPEDPILYFKWLREYGPKAMQVPLHDCFFNRCKSNNAALEGTWAGAVCIVPDWEEWQIPGTLKYRTPQEYGEKLDVILKEHISFNKYRSMAMDFIRDNYDLNKVNCLRVQVILDLLDIK